MDEADQHHYSSTSPHRALMVVGTLLVCLLGGGLVSGWIYYFKERQMRRSVAMLAGKFEKRQPVTLLGDPAPAPVAAPAPPPAAGDSTASVSLADMARPESVPASASPIVALENAPPEVLSECVQNVELYRYAKTWQDKVPLVKGGSAMAAQMKDYYEVQKMEDPVAGSLNGSMRFRFHGVEVITLFYESSRSTGRVDVALIQDATGRWLIDWESLVGYSEMSWTQFKKERPTTAKLFRTFASLGDYWNFEFSDEQKYLSVHMLSPDGLTSLHGFCETGSSLGKEVAAVLEGSGEKRHITFRLAFPPEAESDHCVKIIGLAAERWLLEPKLK